MTFYQLFVPMSSFIIVYSIVLFFVRFLFKGISDRLMNVLFNIGILFSTILWVYLMSIHHQI
ncbi:hypothetical protein ACSVDE_12205 [Pseudalkalibacillus sp. Hm43]|uniref:hypothetical protein n=1 Tax=Pseudalkalibacillus sp. Hm43 TaxID=3450742 RepID=UPI003F4358D5